jgi:hypothetical protein
MTALRQYDTQSPDGFGRLWFGASPSFTLRGLAAHGGPRVTCSPRGRRRRTKGYRISNRHPCRLESPLNPCVSITSLFLIVTKSGVILAWICAGGGLALLGFAECAQNVDADGTEQFAAIDDAFVGHHGIKKQGMGGAVGRFGFDHSQFVDEPARFFCQRL